MSGPCVHSLDAEILAAHEREDNSALAGLYQVAAEQKRNCGEVEAAGFLLTQAYVYALDSGHPSAVSLRTKLIADGREQEE